MLKIWIWNEKIRNLIDSLAVSKPYKWIKLYQKQYQLTD